MIIAGVDYSLTCPGVCVHDTEKGPPTFDNCHHYFRASQKKFEMFEQGNLHGSTHQPYSSDEERYANLAEWARDILDQHQATHIFLEGYAFSASGKVFNIAEATGQLKHELWLDDRYIFVTVPPTVVKKIFTGKGNASKEQMYDVFEAQNPKANLRLRLTPRSGKCISPVSDVIDAYALVKYGYNIVL
jgi:Holliday junction resolvasome RuvABC endonuclease subunit